MLTIRKRADKKCEIAFDFGTNPEWRENFTAQNQSYRPSSYQGRYYANLTQEQMLASLKAGLKLQNIARRIDNMRTSKFFSFIEFCRWLGSWFVPNSWLLPLPYWSKTKIDQIDGAITDISNNHNLAEDTINLLCDGYEYSMLNCLARSHLEQDLRNITIPAPKERQRIPNTGRPQAQSRETQYRHTNVHTITDYNSSEGNGFSLHAQPPAQAQTNKTAAFSGQGQPLGTK